MTVVVRSAKERTFAERKATKPPSLVRQPQDPGCVCLQECIDLSSLIG